MATPPDHGVMVLIDEMLGTFIVASGSQLRLCIEGVLYAPDDSIPETIANLTNPPRDARGYVVRHLTRRLGAEVGQWPPTARSFLFQEIDAYVISARSDGTIVARPPSPEALPHRNAAAAAGHRQPPATS